MFFNEHFTDDYFMAVAVLTAKRSKDPHTQVGACLVDKNNRIVSTGYNQFPKNIEFSWGKSKTDPLENKHSFIVHAEVNAILDANADDLRGFRIFTTLFPCDKCTETLIQSGIKEIIYLSDARWSKPDTIKSKEILSGCANIKCRKFNGEKTDVVIVFNENNDMISKKMCVL